MKESEPKIKIINLKYYVLAFYRLSFKTAVVASKNWKTKLHQIAEILRVLLG